MPSKGENWAYGTLSHGLPPVFAFLRAGDDIGIAPDPLGIGQDLERWPVEGAPGAGSRERGPRSPSQDRGVDRRA